MTTIKLNSKKLAEMRAYYLDGGDTAVETVVERFELEGPEELNGYLQGLRVKYPADFPKEKEEYTYFLRDENNILQELVLVKQKGTTAIFAIKEPTDIVTIMLKGLPVEVDLCKLRKLPPTASEHGLPVARLIDFAELAKG